MPPLDSNAQHSAAFALAGFMLLLAATLPACRSRPADEPAVEFTSGPDASLAAARSGGAETDDPLEDGLARAAADLEAYLNQSEERRPDAAIFNTPATTPSERRTGRPSDGATVIWKTPEPRSSSPAETDAPEFETNTAAPASEPEPDSIANPAPEIPSRSRILVNLARQLHQDAADSDDPLREYLAIASMAILEPERMVDPDTLYNLRTEEQRDLFAAYQEFFIELGRRVDEGYDPEALLETIDRLREAVSPEPTFAVSNFKLTSAVRSFGDYTEFESEAFLRGRSHEVIAYVELENFASVPAQDGSWRTDLSIKLELYTDADGLLVYSQPEATASDTARRRRRDFFLVRHFVLPANLSLGKYHLKIRVRDETSGAEAEAVLPIRIVARSDLVSG